MPGGVLPYVEYTVMCRWSRYGRIFHDVTLPRQRKNWNIMGASGRSCMWSLLLQAWKKHCFTTRVSCEWLYQYISCGLIFRGFHALEVEFFQLNLLHLRPDCLYTPVGCHGKPKTSHGGFAYTLGDFHTRTGCFSTFHSETEHTFQIFHKETNHNCW